MEQVKKPPFIKFSTLSVELPPETNRLLSEAAMRSKRTKKQELVMRLEDHLKNFGNIATVGKRFRGK